MSGNPEQIEGEGSDLDLFLVGQQTIDGEGFDGEVRPRHLLEQGLEGQIRIRFGMGPERAAETGLHGGSIDHVIVVEMGEQKGIGRRILSCEPACDALGCIHQDPGLPVLDQVAVGLESAAGKNFDRHEIGKVLHSCQQT